MMNHYYPSPGFNNYRHFVNLLSSIPLDFLKFSSSFSGVFLKQNIYLNKAIDLNEKLSRIHLF